MLRNQYTPVFCRNFTRISHPCFCSMTSLCDILNVTGEVQFSKNGSTPVVFMHVDQTLQLWAFFDVYGSTQKVRILGSCVEPHHPHTSSGQSYILHWLQCCWLWYCLLVPTNLWLLNCCISFTLVRDTQLKFNGKPLIAHVLQETCGKMKWN